MTSHCESVVLLGGSLPNKGQKAIERAYRRLPEEWRAYKKKHPLLLQAIDAILGYSETARSRALKHGSLGDLTPNIPADLCYLGRFPDSKLQEIKKAIS
ncbi:MAG: hypothetical protein ACJKSS_01265 [Patescibacteria group bacterium UBA2103]